MPARDVIRCSTDPAIGLLQGDRSRVRVRCTAFATYAQKPDSARGGFEASAEMWARHPAELGPRKPTLNTGQGRRWRWIRAPP
jgi:hypothetical protein